MVFTRVFYTWFFLAIDFWPFFFEPFREYVLFIVTVFFVFSRLLEGKPSE